MSFVQSILSTYYITFAMMFAVALIGAILVAIIDSPKLEARRMAARH